MQMWEFKISSLFTSLLFITCSALIPISGFGDDLPSTWEEVKLSALRFNSKPKAIDAELEAQSALTRVVSEGRKPRLGLDLSVSHGRGRTLTSNDRFKSRSLSGDIGLYLSWTLFQCGLHYLRLEASEIEERIRKHRFNSTKFFINNTKGTVVAQSFQAYSAILYQKERLSLFPYNFNYLKALAPVAEANPSTALDVRLATTNLENSAQFAEQDYDSALDVFVYWVTQQPSERMVGLQQAINELVIPETSEEAYEISLRKSPDILQAMEQIRSAELQIKIAEAAFCPTVSLSAGVSTGRSLDRVDSSNSASLNGRLGVFIDVPIYDASASAQVDYQRKALIARRLSQQSALEDAKFELDQTYKNLEFQTRNQQSYQDVVDEMMDLMNQTIDDIVNKRNLPNPNDEGELKDWIDARLGYMSRLRSSWGQLSFTKQSVLNSKFSVQQTTGELFNDEMRAQLSE